MPSSPSAIKQKIREVGLRVTAPRMAVLQAMSQAERPLSHAEVAELLGGEAAPWDRATVYRNLVALVDVGVLRVASHTGGLLRYEWADAEEEHGHPHFVCEDCGIVSCLPSTDVVLPKVAKWQEALRDAMVQLVG